MKIVLDAMGGDHAPGVVIDGAVQAVRDLGVEVILVGPEERIKHELSRHEMGDLPLLLGKVVVETIADTTSPAAQYKELGLGLLGNGFSSCHFGLSRFCLGG